MDALPRLGQLSPDELQRHLTALDAALEQLAAEERAVEDGTHPEFLLGVGRLQAAKEAREQSARQSFEAEMLSESRLHELELAAASKQLERGIELAREKILDQIAAKAKLAEARWVFAGYGRHRVCMRRRDGNADDSTRMSTRSLRSKARGPRSRATACRRMEARCLGRRRQRRRRTQHHGKADSHASRSVSHTLFCSLKASSSQPRYFLAGKALPRCCSRKRFRKPPWRRTSSLSPTCRMARNGTTTL